jgi:hypothetical protein
MHGSFYPLDVLLGRMRYSEQVVEERAVIVPMPEGAHAAHAKLLRASWKRPRWPFAHELNRVTIDVPEGVPVPGKGENSYDCGPDAIFGTTVTARTIEDGVGELVASALQTRRRRGARPDYNERETRPAGGEVGSEALAVQAK